MYVVKFVHMAHLVYTMQKTCNFDQSGCEGRQRFQQSRDAKRRLCCGEGCKDYSKPRCAVCTCYNKILPCYISQLLKGVFRYALSKLKCTVRTCISETKLNRVVPRGQKLTYGHIVEFMTLNKLR